MKIFVKIVLFFFVLFLVTPAIVEWVEKDKATTVLVIDDSTPSSIEEIKMNLKYYTLNPFFEMSFLDFKKASGLIIFENLSKHDLICASIFIPPPNKV
jgi:hypothetical protein